MSGLLLIIFSSFLSSVALGAENPAPGMETVSIDLTHHIVGYLSVIITITAYIAAMSEEVIELRKFKPILLGSALTRFSNYIFYFASMGQLGSACIRTKFNSIFMLLQSMALVTKPMN